METKPEKVETSIVPKIEGIEVSINDRSLFFPTAEIHNVGCKNCIWKLHNQCPHGLKEDEMLDEGICTEMLNFLASLVEKDDDLTAVWERFHIYKARLQEALDYKDFIELENKIKEQEGKCYSREDRDKLDRLKMDKTAAKIWWSKLNQHVIESMRKINDRSSKTKDSGKIPGIYGAKTVNFNITTDNKQIEGKTDGTGS